VYDIKAEAYREAVLLLTEYLNHVDSVLANGIYAAKLFQLFVKERVVTIIAKINNGFYDCIRIRTIRSL